MVIKKSMDEKDFIPLINKFIEKGPAGKKTWFLVISSPSELIIRRSGQKRLGELEGVGENIWKDVDVEKYLSEERTSWV